jgi:3-oxoacyl-[acyl-carrier-protein] synthase-1
MTAIASRPDGGRPPMPPGPAGPRIAGVGAHAALGLSALQVTMNARARKRAPTGTALRDKRGFLVGACVSGALDPGLHGYERLMGLAVPALREALIDAGRGAEGPPPPLVLAVPEAGRADDDPRLSQVVTADLAQRSGAAIDAERSRVFRAGHAGFAYALRHAVDLLAHVPEVLVGAVDSYLHPGVIRWLDEECRLHSLDAENGFVPGEGAAFAVLSRDGSRRRAGVSGETASPYPSVIHCATDEERTVLSDEPNVAVAMTRLVHSAMAGRTALAAGSPPLPWVLCDLNGEAHRNHEWSQVAIRARFADGVSEWHPADDLGDVGAASGALFLAMACTLWATGCPVGRAALVALHAEGVERGVFVLGGAA